MSAQSTFPESEPASYVAATSEIRTSAGTAAASGVTSTEEPTEERYVRTKLLRRIAHDIASPAGVTMTVLDELAPMAPPELLAMARRGLKRLFRLSEQLALTAELEGGDYQPERQADDLSTLVRQAVDLAQGIDGRRDVALACDLAADARLTVDVDRRVVLAALREVVGNALRHASSRVVVDVMIADARARVRVQDDGPGFAKDALEHLGQRFTTRAGARGLGLSLSLAKEILEAHGGRLYVETSELPIGRRGVPGAAVIVELDCR